jgi:hypothetical protein
MLASLGVAAVLVIACWMVLARLGSPRGRAAAPDALGGLARPAMVNLVLCNCTPGAAAYQATILELAARGLLTVSNDQGDLLVTLPQAPPGAPGLTDYERQVLGDVRARLADTGAAPFAALAEACAVDVRGTWDPFEKKLIAEARDRGICRPLLPLTARTVLLVFAATAAIAAVTVLVAWPHRLGALDGPVWTPLIAVIVFWFGLGQMEDEHRLTATGRALAAACQREQAALAAAGPVWDDPAPASLRRRAFAVAGGIAEAVPGSLAPGAPGPGRRRGVRRLRAARPESKQRPGDAWSSYSGSWRLVKTGPGEGTGMGAGVAMLAGAVWLAVIAYAVHLGVGAGPVLLIPLAGAALLAVGGVRRLIRLSALPDRATFDGQVIARWEQETDSENGSSTVRYISVDDGQRGWTFSGDATYNRLGLGDLVRVMVNPRSRKLIELTVTGRPRAQPQAAAGPPGAGLTVDEPVPPRTEPLLAAAEVTGLLGPEVRTTPLPSAGGRGVVYQGRAASLTVMVVSGRVADMNLWAARKRGVPLPGVGDEAWLVNREPAVLVRAGAQAVKLMLSGGTGPQDAHLLAALAATVAARLAAQDLEQHLGL